jgi:hypothetical protein
MKVIDEEHRGVRKDQACHRRFLGAGSVTLSGGSLNCAFKAARLVDLPQRYGEPFGQKPCSLSVGTDSFPDSCQWTILAIRTTVLASHLVMAFSIFFAVARLIAWNWHSDLALWEYSHVR